MPGMCPFELPGEKSGDQNEPLNLEELGSPVPGEALTENFNPYDYAMVMGEDGLPREAGTPWQSQDAATIPLTPETVKCLPQAPRDPTCAGLAVCKYYKRQRVHNPAAPDRAMIQRFCTVTELRGINGACMALDDAGIFDCEFRDPPDPEDTRRLDAIDCDKITKGRIRLREEAATGTVHGYRMFRTPEDVAAGKYVLDENEISTAELNRPKAVDPFAADEVPPPPPVPSAENTLVAGAHPDGDPRSTEQIIADVNTLLTPSAAPAEPSPATPTDPKEPTDA